jgi:hypothetical protein
MKHIDPDILSALKTIAGPDRRVIAARKRHKEHDKERLTTFLELLADKIEEKIPRSSPLFLPALLLVAARKVRAQLPREEVSPLEEGWPSDW